MGFFSRNLERFLGKALNKYYINSFLQIGNINATFDFDKTWAIETAYSKNPDVYTIVNQMSSKAAQIPFYVKKIKDEKRLSQFKNNRKNITFEHLKAKNNAFDEFFKELPLDKPNPLYGWKHFIQLYETYMALTGDVFIYKHLNELEEIKGYYILPSNFMRIYLKGNNFEFAEESPVLGYEMSVSTGQSVPFSAEEIIHIKLPNPVWNTNGEQLYGFSPLKAAYYNVENVIQANKHLYKMFKSSGAFGFIFSKGESLDKDQAQQFKDRILEMDASKERLAKIAGIGTEIGFQRIALSNKDMEPWNALQFDRKTIANVLGWSDKLMNNDGKSTLSKDDLQDIRKRVLLDTVLPHIELLEEALTDEFKQFKGYEKTRVVFDITEMPEVQDDIQKIIEWATTAPLSVNEVRDLINYDPYESEVADKPLIKAGYMTVDELEARGFDIPINDERGAS